jgi:hypothetical protein
VQGLPAVPDLERAQDTEVKRQSATVARGSSRSQAR